MNNIHRLLSIFLFVVIFLPALAQNSDENEPKMSIASFELVNNDMTANLDGTMVLDRNGDKAALIKIETTEKDFSFNVGSLGIERIEWQNENHPAEIWVYVPFGVKTITIQHPVFGVINAYDLGQSLKKAKTYRMVLTSSQVNQLVVNYEHMLPFNFDIFPAEATLMLNGVPYQKENEQQFTATLPAGIHNYRITAEYYYPESGKFTLDDDEETHHLKVVLKPNYGYLTIPANEETEGAVVYVDNVQKGTIPLNKEWVKSGDHTVTINQKLYKPYTTNIVMTDTATIVLNPVLDPHFAEVDFIIDDKDVYIYDNSQPIEFKNGRFHTRLEEGTHQIVVKKANHDSTSKLVTVKSGEPQIINLESPSPIYGYLSVNSNKTGAKVSLNGNEIGTTPLSNYRVLIGNYNVSVSNPGFKTENQEVTITRDQLKKLDFELNGWCPAYVYSKPDDAEVYINGNFAGTTPHQLNLYDGDYTIKVEKKGYLPYSKKKHFDAFTQDFTVRLNPDYVKANEFYVQAGYNFTGMNGLGLGAGFYGKNVNVEFNYVLSLKDTDEIYFNSTSNSNSISMVYKPEAYDFKIGYGIGVLGRLRFTPFIGGNIVTLKAHEDYTSGIDDLDKTTAGSVTFGLKLEVVPVNHISIFANGQYMLPVFKSDTYQSLYDISSQMKGYINGFGLSAGIKFFF